jgi:hypothetical protein
MHIVALFQVANAVALMLPGTQFGLASARSTAQHQ